MQIRKQDGAPEPDCALEALCVLLLLYDFFSISNCILWAQNFNIAQILWMSW